MKLRQPTTEPGKAAKITDSYFVEYFYLPKSNVPDLKAKYTIDTDSQEGVVDTRTDEATVSTAYRLSDWLDVKADFTHTTDRVQGIELGMGFDRMHWRLDRSQRARVYPNSTFRILDRQGFSCGIQPTFC